MLTFIRIAASRGRGWFRQRRRDAELGDEIQAHLDLLTDDFLRRGLPPHEARAAARREFGGVEAMKETYRDQRGLPLIDALVQDVRYGARMLRKSPAFTAVAVLSLALGIGATTAVFSVLNAAVLRPLPVSEPERLVIVSPQLRGKRFVLFNPVFEELRRRQRTLSGMFAINDDPYHKVRFSGSSASEYVRGSLVSGNYFSTLGVSPALGRLLTERDDHEADSTACAMVISYSFWVQRFSRSPVVLGQQVRSRDTECAIVGVASPGFSGHVPGYTPDLWVPLRAVTDPKSLASHTMAFFSGVMGRLRPGVTIAGAQAELVALYQQIQAGEPPQPPRGGQPAPRLEDFRISVDAGAQGLATVRRQFGEPLRLVLIVVGMVLLIAAVNVGNLLIARGTARLPELATRAALGAGRARLVRQLATEGSLLAALGGVAGCALAWLGTPVLASFVSLGYMPLTLDTSPDGRVVAIALASTTFAALCAGLLPAVRLSRATLQAGMAAAGRTASGRHGQRLARTLVAGQLAVSLLLVTAAALLTRTVVHIAGVDPGFRPDHVIVLDVRDEEQTAAPVADHERAAAAAAAKAQRAVRYRTLEDRLSALPGVRTASVSWLGLFGGSDLWLNLIDADRPEMRAEGGRVDYVSARYFDTVGMQILRGRGFTDDDREGLPRVAVVNETLIRERFTGVDPIGRRLALDYTGEQARPFTIVGVVRDSKYNDLREDRVRPMMWVPLAQAPFRITSVALRVDPDMEGAVARAARATISSVSPHLMVRVATTLSAQVRQTTVRERLLLGLASAFGSLAVLLAAIGLYGTLAYAVTCRTREIGVRLALGARAETVLWMVLGESLTLTAFGLCAGVPLALGGGSLLRGFLFGVAPYDIATLVTASVILALVALVAGYVPARRASRVDPMVALRYE